MPKVAKKSSKPQAESPATIPEAHEWTHDVGHVRGLKRLNGKKQAHGGFQYPAEGEWAHAEKWVATADCGNGLHFWPWGLGIGDGAEIHVVNDVFAVVEAVPGEIVGHVGDADGPRMKAKAKRLRVVKYGSLAECQAILTEGRIALIAVRSNEKSSSSGYRSASSSSGAGSASSSSGYRSASSSSGDYSASSSSGDYSASSSSGDYSASSSSGDYSASSSSGDYSASSSSGDYSASSSSGYRSASSSSGAGSASSSSGDYSASSSSGDYSASSSSGDYSASSSSGYRSASSSSGYRSAAVAIGQFCKAKSDTPGALLVLVAFDRNTERHVCRSAYVGENGIEPGVLYTLDEAFNFVAVKEDD